MAAIAACNGSRSGVTMSGSSSAPSSTALSMFCSQSIHGRVAGPVGGLQRVRSLTVSAGCQNPRCR